MNGWRWPCCRAYAASLSKLDKSMARIENQIGSVLCAADRKIGLTAASKSSKERNGVTFSSPSAARMARAKPVLASLAPTPLVRWGAAARREIPSMTTTVLGCASSEDMSAWIGHSRSVLLSGLLSIPELAWSCSADSAGESVASRRSRAPCGDAGSGTMNKSALGAGLSRVAAESGPAASVAAAARRSLPRRV